MNHRFLLKFFTVVLLAALGALLAPPGARAQLGVFSNEDIARMHCPNDEVVWLDFRKRRYYTRGQRLYARGTTAVFACRAEAKRSGYKKSRLGLR